MTNLDELTEVQIAFGVATTQTEIDPEQRWQAIKLVSEYLGKLRLLATARPAQEPVAWQPIETAPRDGSRLLGTGGGLEDTVEVISYNDRVGAWNTENYTLDDCDNEADGYSRPSHWQPMPSAYTGEQDKS